MKYFMKLILLIILIIFGFQSSAWGQAPTLSIEAKQEPIQEIMKKNRASNRHDILLRSFYSQRHFPDYIQI